MDKGYELYCLTDPQFYDSATLATAVDEPFAISCRETPIGWRSNRMDDWLVYTPEGVRLPSQGWKIHASACLDNAERIVDTIWDYCVRERIAFKFIRSRQLLFLRNMKYAARGYSGKFVTIFPVDEQQFERILTELAPALDGFESPYILSDLRWGDGPLYVRYGGFAERFCVGANGDLEPAIENADGELVPDRRGATFQVPPVHTLRRVTAQRRMTCRIASSARCISPTAAVSTRASTPAAASRSSSRRRGRTPGSGATSATRSRASDASATRSSNSPASVSRPPCATTSSRADTTSWSWTTSMAGR
jgi:hypothetical protein